MNDEFTTAAWRRHHASVLSYLRRRLGDPTLAEDLAQETFLRLHRAQPDVEAPAQLRAWLLRTARHLLVDHYRARRPEQPLEAGPEPAAFATPLWRAFEPCIEPLAGRLPEIYRAALLWDLDGVPQRAIAERQGIGLSGAKSRVQRARGLLAEEFARCCSDPDDADLAAVSCSTAGPSCA